jgi:gamma-glutamyltranspeptidase/glutathione hydrolase
MRVVRVTGIALLSVSLCAQSAREQTRSVVTSQFGIVATSQTLASQAGAMILERGGNAIDAAIAANATLGVVQPGGNGIGGDLFAIIYEASTGKIYGLNASGWTPAKLSIEFLHAKGIDRLQGIHTVTVPGAVAGWDAMRRRFGKLPFEQLLRPAIFYAENGYPVSELIAHSWAGIVKKMAEAPNFASTWLIDGHAPQPGELFRNPDLAGSLRLIAARGRDGFYKGRTAEAIVQLSKETGGAMEAADLAEFQPEWVDPVSTTYHGWTVFELPPNGHGVAALEMLNIMERFPLHDWGHNSARSLHVLIEAKKLAYADMLKYVGDPRFVKMPVARLISKALAEERAGQIAPDRASCHVEPADLDAFTSADWRDTIYMSAIDRDGNIVSLIQSLSSHFGTGFVPPHTGFPLHNRGGGFSLTPGLPNSLAPRKRPLHTLVPGFMQKEGIRIGFGIMGGWNQAQAHAQFVSNIADYGVNVHAAIDAARFTKQSFAGCDLTMESRIPVEVRQELARLGHQIKATAPFSDSMGRGQAVMRDAHGINHAGSDARGDGSAVPQGPPVFTKQ